jgi:hypothetical protein
MVQETENEGARRQIFADENKRKKEVHVLEGQVGLGMNL